MFRVFYEGLLQKLRFFSFGTVKLEENTSFFVFLPLFMSPQYYGTTMRNT